MPVTKYRSVADMPPPWRHPSDPANLRVVARMMAFHRRLLRAGSVRGPRIQKFRSIEESNAHHADPLRRSNGAPRRGA